jgi:threonine/homoserine/homoserine lactone efflux protein
MLDLGLLLPFLGAIFILLILPGPTLALLLSTGVAKGRSAALYTCFGISAAVLTTGLAKVFGLAPALASQPGVFNAIQGFGVAYLLYLAYKEWHKAAQLKKPQSAVLSSKHFWRGFMVDALNPESLLFLIGFLPQFVNPALGSVKTQLFLLCLLYTVCNLGFNITVACLSSRTSKNTDSSPQFLTIRRYGLFIVYIVLAFYFGWHMY